MKKENGEKNKIDVFLKIISKKNFSKPSFCIKKNCIFAAFKICGYNFWGNRKKIKVKISDKKEITQ